MTNESAGTDRDHRIDAAIAEYLQAAETGAAPDREQFLARYPDLVGELAEFLDDRRRLQQLFPVERGRERPSVSSPPPQLGDFRIIRPIGRGGMAVVYEAEQRSLRRRVALKVLPAETLDNDAVARFRREVAAVARLRHPHIVPIIATGEEQGTHYFAMELIDGPSLDAILRKSKQPPRTRDEFTRLAEQLADVADALHHAHQAGIIHRDIKPSNLLQSSDGRLLIGDFGLARVAFEPGLTQSGQSIGSPTYMSPEQIAPVNTSAATPLNHRTDVYSLGVTLFEMLTLRPPFTGETREEVLAQIVMVEPPAPRRLNVHVPADLQVICLKSLEKDPRHRFATAAELAAELRRFARGEPIASRLPGVVERLVRWTRRRPVLAATLAVTASVMLTVCVATLFIASDARTSRAALRAGQLQQALDDALVATFSGDLATADEAILRAEQLGARTGRVTLLRGQSAYFRGDYAQAADRLQQAAAELPHDVAAQSMFAAACVAAGRWEEYETTLAGIGPLAPASPEDYLFRGLAETYLDPRRGLQSLDEAVRLRNWPIARLIRAEVRTRLAQDTGDPRDAAMAVDDAKFALEMLPDHVAARLVSLDTHLVAEGIFADAGDADRRHFSRQQAARDAAALERFSHLPLVVVNRALYLQLAERYADGLAALRNAATDRPDEPILAYNLALALYRAGQPIDALAELEHKPDLTGNGEWLRIWLRMEQGDRAAVLDTYNQLAARESAGLEVLFRPCLLLLLGERSAAVAESQSFRNRPNVVPRFRTKFYEQLLAYNCDQRTDDDLLAAAGTSRWDRCEAEFFLALHHLAAGDRGVAREHFRACLATRCHGTQAWDWSAIALARLDADAKWPAWIPSK